MQTVIVERDVDAVVLLRWLHLLGAPCFRSVFLFQKSSSPKPRVLSHRFTTPTTLIYSVDWGQGILRNSSEFPG